MNRVLWEIPMAVGTCRVIEMRASTAVQKWSVRSVFWDGVRARSRATVITRVTRHTTVTHPPHSRAPSKRGNDGVLSSLFILSTEGAAPLRHLRGTESRAHLLSEKRAEGTKTWTRRNLHANQDARKRHHLRSDSAINRRRNRYFLNRPDFLCFY